ncbi:hypothetical protein PENSPDRAFT_694511 [Peniophora sp. CONT]|nr:hypothetical protein PENSPDRAFT_694511 [Peniophora sp. CONT]
MSEPSVPKSTTPTEPAPTEPDCSGTPPDSPGTTSSPTQTEGADLMSGSGGAMTASPTPAVQPSASPAPAIPPQPSVLVVQRWSTKPVFTTKEQATMRGAIPQYEGTKTASGAVKLDFWNKFYDEFVKKHPDRAEEEKRRLAAENNRRKAREAAAAAAAAVIPPIVDKDTPNGDEGPKEGEKKKKKKNPRDEDPLWEPDLLSHIKTWFRNKKGVRGATSTVLMTLLGDDYNDGIRDEYVEWKKTATQAQLEKTPLIKYRVDRATTYLKTADPEVLEKVEIARNKAPGAGGMNVEVKLDSDVEMELDDTTKEEALRVARAEKLEDNINLLKRSYGKLPTQLYKQTGMMCIMTFIGPRPSHGGRLQAFSFHTALPGDPRTFANTYPQYKDGVSKPLIEFARSVYTQAACDAVSLSSDKEESSDASKEVRTAGARTDGPAQSSKRRRNNRDSDHSSDEEDSVEGPLLELDPKLKRILDARSGPAISSSRKSASKPAKKKTKPDAPSNATKSTAERLAPKASATPTLSPPSSRAPSPSSRAPSSPVKAVPPSRTDTPPTGTSSKPSSPGPEENVEEEIVGDKAFVLASADELRDLVDADSVPDWSQIVDAYIDLERIAGYPESSAVRRMATALRPREVVDWVNRGRIWFKAGNVRYDPGIEDTQMYGSNIRSWYSTLQPKWRGENLPYKQDRRDGELWPEFLRVGRNGVLGLIWAVGWWWRAAKEPEDKEEVDDMLQELAWALGELVFTIKQGDVAQSLRREKAEGTAERGDTTKRKKTKR